jgi:outer membrane protein assembly factor BamB
VEDHPQGDQNNRAETIVAPTLEVIIVRDLVFIGIAGHALALDRATGQEVWRTKLKGSDFVNVTIDGREVFAAARGQLYCLDASTGSIRWENELKGLGWGLLSIAGGNAATASEAERRQRAAAAASASS